MMTAFASCAKKFHTEFVLGLRPPTPSVDLHAGICSAKAIEIVQRGVWHEGLPFHEALMRGHAAFVCEWGDFQAEKETSKTLDNTWSAIELYFATFPPERDHVQPYYDVKGRSTNEFSFAIPLEPAIPYERYASRGSWANDPTEACSWHADGHHYFPLHPVTREPFLWCGRFDLLGILHGKHPCVRDEKTSGRLMGNWADSWNLRRQFLGYHWACHSLGIPVEYTVARGIIIRSPTAKAGKGNEIVEAQKPYSRQLIAKWHEQTRRDLWRMVKCWEEEYWDFNLGEACTQYGLCPFMDLCESHLPENFYDNFIVHRWSPIKENVT